MSQSKNGSNDKGRGKNSINLSLTGIDMVNQARIMKGWNKTESAWHDFAGVSKTTLKRFLNGEGITPSNFRNLCEVIGITDWQSLIDWDKSDYTAVVQVNSEFVKPQFSETSRSVEVDRVTFKFLNQPASSVSRTSCSAENSVVVSGRFDASNSLQVEMTSEDLVELLHDGKLSIKEVPDAPSGIFIRGIYNPEQQLQIETVLYHLQELLIGSKITIADSSLEIKNLGLPSVQT